MKITNCKEKVIEKIMTHNEAEMSLKEEQDRCRSLICDSNGIIVAEMVYRCMICYCVSDTMKDAKLHYKLKHMDEESSSSLHDDLDDEMFTNKANNLINNNNNNNNNCNSNNNNNNSTSIYGDYPGVPDMQGFYEPENGFSPDDSDNMDHFSPLITMSEGFEPIANGSVNGGKSGYVNCAVCGVTRFYSCVQRRYGQFTCVTCYRYFRTFLLKPKRFSCPNLGKCQLNVRTRCRACWLHACISVFSVDLRRQEVIDAFRPLRKSSANKNAIKNEPENLKKESIVKVESTNVGETLLSNSPKSQLRLNSPSPSSPDTKTLLAQFHKDYQKRQQAAAAATDDKNDEKSTITVSFNSGDELPSMLERNDFTSIMKKELKKLNNTGKVTPGKKVWSCGKCATCLAEDCGKCIYCLDRPKFGGPFIKKQRCIKRRCLMKVKNKQANGVASAASLVASTADN